MWLSGTEGIGKGEKSNDRKEVTGIGIGIGKGDKSNDRKEVTGIGMGIPVIHVYDVY